MQSRRALRALGAAVALSAGLMQAAPVFAEAPGLDSGGGPALRGLAPPTAAARPPGGADAIRILEDGRRWEVFFAPVPLLRLGAPVLWGSATCWLDGRRLEPGREYVLEEMEGLLRLLRPPAAGVVEVLYRPHSLLAARGLGERWRLVPGTPRTARVPLRTRLAAALARTAPLPAPTPSAAVDPRPLAEQFQSGVRLTELREQYGDRAAEQARLAYFRADPLDPQAAGQGREEVSTDLTLRPNPGARFVFDSYLARESLFAEESQEIERRRLQFEQTFGKSTAALMWERRRSDGYGVASALDALSLSLTHPFTRNTSTEGFFIHENSAFLGSESRSAVTLRQLLGTGLEAQASLGFRASEYLGQSLEGGLTLFARPGAGDLTLSLRQSDSEAYGRFRRLSADLVAPVGSRLQLMGQLSRRSSEQFGDLTTLGLGVTARPTARSLLEAAVSQSDGSTLGRDRSHTLRLSLDPSAALQLRLGLDLLTSSQDGESRNALWMLALGGHRYLKFEGYSGFYEPPEGLFYRDTLYRLEGRPIDPLLLSASLRRVEGETDARAIAGAGATLRLTDRLDVSAAYRLPTDAPEPASGPALSLEPGHDLRLSFAAIRGLRLFGQYAVRPEDERGALLDQRHRSLGLEARLGALLLQGSYTQIEGAEALDPGRRIDLLASLAFGERLKLYGGYRTEAPPAGDALRSQLFRLGISHSAGRSFLLLEGQVGRLLGGSGGAIWNPEDTRAQARVGLRF